MNGAGSATRSPAGSVLRSRVSRGLTTVVEAPVRSVFVLATVASALLWVVGWSLGWNVTTGSLATGFGVAAAVVMGAVMLYSGRRSLPHVRALGRTRYYLDIHLYGGVLFLFLVFLHTGFRWPSGVLDVTLWLLTLWVVGTGAFGLALQKWLPKTLRSAVSIEVNRERIPELVEELRVRAAEAVDGGGDSLRQFHADHLAPALAGPEPRGQFYLGLFQDPYGLENLFERLGPTLETKDRDQLAALREIYHSKVEMDVHLTLQDALRRWLYAHLPTAVALIALLVFHVFLVTYY